MHCSGKSERETKRRNEKQALNSGELSLTRYYRKVYNLYIIRVYALIEGKCHVIESTYPIVKQSH